MATITSTELGAAGRYINFGSPAALDNLGSMTVMAYMRVPNTGSAAQQYIACKCAADATPGWRFAIEFSAAVDRRIVFGVDSTGAAAAPQAFCEPSGAASTGWVNFAVTWDGSINHSGILMYRDGTTLVKDTYVNDTKDGSGSINSDASESFWLMNRPDSARPFVGDLAYVAVWNRVLSASDVADARTNGPLDVSDGLVFCWANQQDYSTNAITPTARSTYVAGTTPTTYTDLGEITAQDVTAPTLTSATATATGATTASGSVSTDEANGTLYYLVNASATATATEVKAGLSQAGSATGSQSVSVTGLTASTSYYLHFLHRDSAGNDSTVLTTAQFTTTAAIPSLSIATRFDGENIDRTISSITDADTAAPTVNIRPRLTTTADFSANAQWGQFCFKLSNANGKRPYFVLNAANWAGAAEVRKQINVNYWRPWYSYDGETWTRWDAAPTNPSGSTWNFRLSAAFTGDVFIAFAPNYPVSRGLTLAQWVETNHPTMISTLIGADNADYRVGYVSAQTDEAGATIPAQPVRGFAIGGGAKTVLMLSGMHGYETMGGWALDGAVKFLCSTDPVAVFLRSAYKFLVYPCCNPSGRYGGHYRGQWQLGLLGADPNRDFGTQSLESTQLVVGSVAANISGNVSFIFDFHSADLALKSDNVTPFASGFYYFLSSVQTAGNVTNWSNAVLAHFAEAEYEVSTNTGISIRYFMDTYSADYSVSFESLQQYPYLSLDNVAALGSGMILALDTLGLAAAIATITLHAGTTPQASISNVVALWWDATAPSGAPDYSTTTASTDASGVLTLDLDSTTALSIGDSGFLLLYKLDATDHRDSLVFAGRVAVSDIA